MVSHHQVLSYYRQLLRLIGRLPLAQATAARDEAHRTIRARSNEADPEQALKHVKELAAKISFLRMTTPRPPGEPVDSGHFVYRDGSWVEDEGKDKGTRYAPNGQPESLYIVEPGIYCAAACKTCDFGPMATVGVLATYSSPLMLAPNSR